MVKVGPDVWTVQGTGILKRRMRDGVGEVVEGLAEEGLEEVEEVVNGHDADDGRGESAEEISNPDGEEGDADTNNSEKEMQKLDPADASDAPIVGETNGEDINPQQQKHTLSKEDTRAISIQRLFDILYLDNALTLPSPTNPNEESDPLNQLQQSMAQNLGNLGVDDVERMRKGAWDYWGRTELIFGLLKL
ncbi:MAG: hypothetical protein Q9183_008093 [Haloplaca sp. 2 TL-2023]